jgi:hypothetical protein
MIPVFIFGNPIIQQQGLQLFCLCRLWFILGLQRFFSKDVLRKNGFQMVVHAVDEDWGYDKPTVTDKWIR